jgi:hypothetical protein
MLLEDSMVKDIQLAVAIAALAQDLWGDIIRRKSLAPAPVT